MTTLFYCYLSTIILSYTFNHHGIIPQTPSNLLTRSSCPIHLNIMVSPLKHLPTFSLVFSIFTVKLDNACWTDSWELLFRWLGVRMTDVPKISLMWHKIQPSQDINILVEIQVYHWTIWIINILVIGWNVEVLIPLSHL